MNKALLLLDKIGKLFSGETGKYDNDPAVALAKILANYASTTGHVGLVELATAAEAQAMTSTSLVVTPAGVAAEVQSVALQGGVDTAALAAMFAQHYTSTPALGTATAVHAAVTLADAATTVVTTAFTNPDYPRTLTVKGNAAGITGNVVAVGTNALDAAITDTIALDAANEVEGIKAFKTVTQVTFPARNAPGDTVSVGVGNKIGLMHIAYNAACLLLFLFDGSADTGGTLAADADEVEKNLYTPAGTFDGAKVLDLIYLV